MADQLGVARAGRAAVRVGALCVDDDSQSVAVSRAWLRDLLIAGHVHDECVEIAVLIVSELVSNAIRHGNGHVICHAVLDRGACTLTVLDFGSGSPTVVDRRVDTIGGLGMVIVERLARGWGVAPFDGGKAVYAVLDADPADPAGSADAVA